MLRITFNARPLRPRRTAHRAAILTAIVLVLTSAVASAHARFDHSTPMPGQVLTSSPTSVDIYTEQDMQKTAGAYGITVMRDDAGTPGPAVDNGTTVMDDANRKHFSVALQPNLPPGRYLVSFHNVSDEDGDADHGQFAFYIGAGPTAAQQALDSKLQISSAVAPTPAPATAAAASGASHTGVYVAIVAVGVAVLVIVGALFAWSRRTRRRI